MSGPLSRVEIEYLGGETIVIQDYGLIEVRFERPSGRVVVATQGGGCEEVLWEYVGCIRAEGSVKLV